MSFKSMVPSVVTTVSIEAAELLSDAIERLLISKGELDSEFENVWSGTYGFKGISVDSTSKSLNRRRQLMMVYFTQLRKQKELLGQLQIVLETRMQLLEVQIEQHLEDEKKQKIIKQAYEQDLELQRQEKIRRLERQRRRITSLPRDILSKIFCLCIEPEGSFQPVIMVGSVCTRFRTIALKIPALWAFVSSSMTAEQLDTQLSRAAKRKLNVKIFSAPFLISSAEIDRNWRGTSRLLRYSDRWGQLEIIGDVQVISSQLSSPYLPRLSSILIGNRTPILANVVNRGAAHHEQNFPEWALTTPNLRSINCTNIYPPESFGVSLVTCNLSWVENFRPSPGRLVYVLSKSPALQSLTLDSAIDIYDRSFESQDDSSPTVRAPLKELRELTIIMHGFCAQSACLRIISQISVPKLRTFNVDLGGTLKRNASDYSNISAQRWTSEDSIQNLLRLPHAWDVSPELEEFNFRCDYPQPGQLDCIALLMLKMPALRKLAFDAPHLSPPWLLLLPKLELTAKKIMQGHASIERLEIRNNSNTNIEYIFKLANVIGSMSEASQTMRLSLVDCPGLEETDTESIRSRLPNIEVSIQACERSMDIDIYDY